MSSPPSEPPRLLRVLVVEDDRDLQESIVSVLEEHYEVAAVSDGEEALARLEGFRFDVVLLDLGMPRLDGTGLLLRLAAAGNDTPVIVTSAARDQRARTHGLNVAALLPKPFGMDALIHEIEQVVARRASTAHPSQSASDA